MRKESWTAEMDAELLNRWETESASEIAAAMGNVTRNAVIGRYHRLVGSYDAYNERKAAAAKAETAAKLARKKAVACQVLSRYDLRKHRKEAITAALGEGADQSSIAEILGLTRQRISQIALS